MSSHQEKVLNCYKILFKDSKTMGKPFFAFSSHFVLMHGMSLGGRRQKRSSNNKDNVNKTEN
jgi:hypothetical protein